MNNYSTAGSWDVTTLTGSTNTYNLTTDGTAVWFPYYYESTWLPCTETNYIPKWHITQGYKNQIKSMWD